MKSIITKTLQQYQYTRIGRGQVPQRTTKGILRLMWVLFGLEVEFKLLFERGIKGVCTNFISKSIPHSGRFKSKTITKLFDRLLSRWMKLGDLHHCIYKVIKFEVKLCFNGGDLPQGDILAVNGQQHKALGWPFIKIRTSPTVVTAY